MKTIKKSNPLRRICILSLLSAVALVVCMSTFYELFSGSITLSTFGFGTTLHFGLFLVSFSLIGALLSVLYYLISTNRLIKN